MAAKNGGYQKRNPTFKMIKNTLKNFFFQNFFFQKFYFLKISKKNTIVFTVTKDAKFPQNQQSRRRGDLHHLFGKISQNVIFDLV